MIQESPDFGRISFRLIIYREAVSKNLIKNFVSKNLNKNFRTYTPTGLENDVRRRSGELRLEMDFF